MIYLDNASTTQINPSVLHAMIPYLKDLYGNAGSIHSLGRRAAKAIENARQQVALFIGARPDQIIFTSGGSEANTLAVLGVKEYLQKIGKTHTIVSEVEHESMLKAFEMLQNRCSTTDKMCIKDDFDTSFLRVNKHCHADIKHLKEIIQNNTGLVSVMYANNETGAVNAVESIAKLCKKNNTLFLTDCVQAAGVYKINVNTLECDMLTISSHKIHGPKGVGCLYVRNPEILNPIICGGNKQEFGLRGGTENVAAIVGFGAACEMFTRIAPSFSFFTKQCEFFLSRLTYHLGKVGLARYIHINGCNGKIINIRIEGLDSETLVLKMDSEGVCISSGSACTNHESKPSHVLLAMGLTEDEARSSVRVSLSNNSYVRELNDAAKIMAKSIGELRGVYNGD